jgi:hypothetical protein
MPIDDILNLFFSVCGGIDLFFLACAFVVLGGIFSVLVSRFYNV